MKNTPLCKFACALVVFVMTYVTSIFSSTPLEPRTEFPIGLAKLSLAYNDKLDSVKSVRVSFENPDQWWVICPGDDQYIRTNVNGRQTQLFQEPPQRAYQINRIEADILKKVLFSFRQTLEELDVFLQKNDWASCRYLDGFMPRFLKSFFYLYSISKNAADVLPSYALVADSLYNVSLNSPLTDARIACWKNDPSRGVYLRIIIKELIYQSKQWEKIDLDHIDKNADAFHGTKFEEAFGIFIKLYFNATPVPPMDQFKKPS